MVDRIRLLHVDDDRPFTELVGAFLEREDDRFAVETAHDVESALARLAAASDSDGDGDGDGDGGNAPVGADAHEGDGARGFDCVVSDYDMPDATGVEFLERVRARYGQLPFVLYTGKGSEEVASDAIAGGVTDYLQKGTSREQYAVLANRVANAVEAHRTARDLQRRNRQDRAVATLSRAALEALDPGALFDRVVTVVAERLDAEHVDLLERTDESTPDGRGGRDDRGDRLRVVASEGRSDARVGSLVTVGPDVGASRTLATGDPTVIEAGRDAGPTSRSGSSPDPDSGRTHTRTRTHEPAEGSDPATATGTGRRSAGRTRTGEEGATNGPSVHPTARGIRAGVTVPVGARDDPWGVLGAYTTTRRSFSPDDVRFLQKVANVLASAIERTRVEQRRRTVEARFREIAELSPDAIFRLDTDGVFTYVSPAVEQLVGYEPAELHGTNFRTYVAEGSLETAVEGFSRVVAGEVVRELGVTLVAADGTHVDAELSASPAPRDGTVTHIQGFARDVTDRRARERELRTLKAQYETLVAHLPGTGVFLFDEDLRYRLAGGAELGAVGMSGSDFEGATPADLFPDDIAEETAHYYREALRGHEHTFEQEYAGNHYRIRTVPVRDDDGEVVSGLAVSQNVTERVARRRRLERQNQQLEEFASVVSHDLRNPLSIARGRLTLARTDCECGGDVQDHLREIEAALVRSSALVDDLFALAKSGEGVRDPAPVDFASAVEACWANVPTAEATLTLADGHDRTIVADRGRLGQLLENLFRNAVEHGGSDVSVTVGSLADGFYVEDTGPGVPDTDRGRLFERGFSTTDTGTGYGLRIVERIADAHGWDVTPTDGRAGGARFEVTGVGTVVGTGPEPEPPVGEDRR
jgi:PAS domain S-box-containing protein